MALVEAGELKRWFCTEVLSREPTLTRYIRRHWRAPDEITDIRQEIYEKVLIGAGRGLPESPGGYLFTVARNLIINKARRSMVISIELAADIDTRAPDADWLTPERHVTGREALRRAQEGLERLPPRCREVIWLRKVEGLNTREVAAQLGIGIDAVQQQTMLGMRALADFMLGGEGRIQRPERPHRKIAKDRA